MDASGKRENETAGLSGELLIGDDFLVARLGLGTMRLTGKGIWGEPSDRSEAIRVVRRAVELGVNFIDTADSYGPHVSEGIIAEALFPYPDDVPAHTKVQQLYFDDDFMLRRLDYVTDVLGGVAAHYCYDQRR